AVDDAAELVAAQVVGAERRLARRSVERRADELLGVGMGRDLAGKDGHQDEQQDDDRAHYRRPVAPDAAHGIRPQAALAARRLTQRGRNAAYFSRIDGHVSSGSWGRARRTTGRPPGWPRPRPRRTAARWP